MVSLELCVTPELPEFSNWHQSIPRSPNHKVKTARVKLPSSTAHKPEGLIKAKISPPTYYNPKYAQHVDTQLLVDLLHASTTSSIRVGKLVHGYLLKSNLNGPISLALFNHVAKVYCRSSNFGLAQRLFSSFLQRDVISWTTMIVGSTDNGYFSDGFGFFCDMLISGIFPDEFVYSAVLKSCIGLECLDLGQGLHGQIVKRGFLTNVIVATSLLDMYAKLGDVEALFQVFNGIPVHNHVSCGAMISGLTLNGLYSQAFEYFLVMKSQGISANMYILSAVLKAVGKMKEVGKGKIVHNCIRELGMESNIVLGTSLIDMYSKCGCLPEARSVFNRNFVKSRVSNPWNALISGCLQGEFWLEAMDLFLEMHLNGIRPNVYTYTSILSAIAALRCLHAARQIHGMVVKCSNNPRRYPSVNNAILSAYSKCLSLKDAKMMFDKMVERDVVSWTTLVSAYTQSSRVDEALDIFSQMREQGFVPNEYTFSSVIIGCANVGFLNYGRQVHGLLCKIGLETDNCIECALIVMYAKLANIITAIKVFERIVCPDVVSWHAIISGCARYGLSFKADELVKKMERSGFRPNVAIL